MKKYSAERKVVECFSRAFSGGWPSHGCRSSIRLSMVFVLLLMILLVAYPSASTAQDYDERSSSFQLVSQVTTFANTPIGSNSEMKFQFLFAEDADSYADYANSIEVGVEGSNGAAAEFSVTGGTCQDTLQLYPGDSCTLNIEFAPVQTVGLRDASIFISGRVQYYQGEYFQEDRASFAIEAQAISAPLERRPPAATDLTISGDLDFGSVDLFQQQPVVRRMTISNSSGIDDSRFEILDIVFPDESAFLLKNDFTNEPFNSEGNFREGFPDECRLYLYEGDSCSFDVVFMPNEAGSYSGQLTVGYWWEAYFEEERQAQLSEEFRTAAVNAEATAERPGSVFTFTPVSLEGVEGETLGLEITRSGSSDALSQKATMTFSVSESIAEDVVVNVLDGEELIWDPEESGSRMLEIDLLTDSIPEERESGSLNFSMSETNAIYSAVATENVSNSAPLRTQSIPLVIDDVPIEGGNVSFGSSVLEIPESSMELIIEVARTDGQMGAGSVHYEINTGTAQQGVDYSVDGAYEGDLYWDDEDGSTKNIVIAIAEDTLSGEGVENFTVSLSEAQGVELIEPRLITISILDSTMAGELQLEVSTDQVLESAGEYSINVQRVNGAAGAIEVDYEVVGFSARPDSDFVPVTGKLSWDNGNFDDKPILVSLISDSAVEPDEQFIIRLLDESSSVPITVSQTTVTIMDDSQPNIGNVSFTGQNAVEVLEGNPVSLALTRTGGSDGRVSVTVATTGDTAESGVDFVAIEQTVVWEDGEAGEKIVVVSTLEDTLADIDEKFLVRLIGQEPEGVVSGTASIEVTIRNEIGNPGRFAFAASDYTVREDQPELEIVVKRLDGNEGEAKVNYATLSDSASNADFAAMSGTLVWADGDSTDRIISVAITADTDNSEETENFYLTLSGAVPYGDTVQLGSPLQTTISIVNVPIVIPPENGGIVGFQQQNLDVDEDTETVTVFVDRTDGSFGEISVDYELQGNTATSGEDFVADQGTLSWADGDTGTKIITISIKSDFLVEGPESFTVQLGNLQTGTENVLVSLSAASLDISIADTTELGSIRFRSVEGGNSIAENRGTVVVEVERIGGSDGPVSVDFILVDRTATAGTDVFVEGDNRLGGTLTWEPGDMDPKPISLILNEDTEIESNEDFVIKLLNAQPTDVIIISSELVLTIEGQSTEDGSTPRLTSGTTTQLTGIPGQVLEPIVVSAEAGSAANLSSTAVEWRVVPEKAVKFLQGDTTDYGAVTQLDESGQTSMQVEIVSRGFIQLIASPAGVRTGSSASARMRSDPTLVQITDGEVLIVIRSGFAVASGLNDNQAETGAALDAACERLTNDSAVGVEQSVGQQDLLDTCGKLQVLEEAGNTETLARVLDRLAPEEVFYFADSVVATADIQITNIYSRINAIRSAELLGDVLDVSDLQLNIVGEIVPGLVLETAQNAFSGGGASADELGIASRWGVFVNGEITVGEVDGEGIQRNADLRTNGLTLGTDYRLNKNVVVGAGLGFTVNDTNFTGGEGEASADGLSFSLFGTWYEADEGYADVVLDLGNHSFDMSRRIDLPLEGERLQYADGSTKASTVSLTVGVGRTFNVSGWEFGPYGRMSLINGSVDEYSEKIGDASGSGSGSLLDIGSHSIKSIRFSLGGQVSRVINTRRAVLLPQIRVEFESETEDKKDPVEAVFQNDPTQTSFEVQGNTRDTSFINVGIGSSFVFQNGKSAFVFYETRAQHDFVTQHSLKLGLRLVF